MRTDWRFPTVEPRGDSAEWVLIDLLAFQAAAAKVTVQSDEQFSASASELPPRSGERILARNRVAAQHRREQGGQARFSVSVCGSSSGRSSRVLRRAHSVSVLRLSSPLGKRTGAAYPGTQSATYSPGAVATPPPAAVPGRAPPAHRTRTVVETAADSGSVDHHRQLAQPRAARASAHASSLLAQCERRLA